jgi:hypothetical protein
LQNFPYEGALSNGKQHAIDIVMMVRVIYELLGLIFTNVET